LDQAHLEPADLEEKARALGLDMTRFVADRDNPHTAEMLAKDMADGAKVGARGTPTTFINGRRVNGAQPEQVFDAVIASEVKRFRDSGLSPAAYRQRLQKDALSGDSRAPKKKKPAVSAGRYAVDLPAHDSFVLRNPEAPITWVIFSEFECPFCQRLGPTVEHLKQKYPTQLRIVFRHQPLSFHHHAKGAALAALAAANQGKFVEFSDAVFADQGHLEPADLEEKARALGLDMERFVRDRDSPQTLALVEEDMADGGPGGRARHPHIVHQRNPRDGLPAPQDL
jgi:protein-disulfide isomerase